MNRKELTYRLSMLGMKKQDFAAKLGLAPDTLYQWEQTPQYAEALLEALEENAALKRVTTRRPEPTRFNDDVPIGKGRKK